MKQLGVTHELFPYIPLNKNFTSWTHVDLRKNQKEELNEEGSGITMFSSLKDTLAGAIQSSVYKTARMSTIEDC